MPVSASEERLFVSTTPGLEPALDRELCALGLGVRRVPGGAEVRGPKGLHRRLNLWLRTASRVVLRVAEFPARDVPALQRGLQAAALSPYWDGRMPLRIGVATHRSRLHHTAELRQIAARAWNATVASANPKAGDGEEEGGAQELLVQLRIDRDVCTVSVDTSGELLYRRGYRQEVSRAPLRETLAAGVLGLADYRGDEPLWDPMCGSGTLPIEAAWIALGRAPGPGRESGFAFERFPSHDREAWQRERDEARQNERPTPRAPIYASDINAGALGTARRNARRAGVQPHLKLERSDLLRPTFVPTERHGLLVANLPYGVRVGDRSDLPALYAALGTMLRERLPGWRGALLVADGTGAEQSLGLELDDAFDVENGGIRCRLLLVRGPVLR
ncbi:MAG: RNA methyltransferase [Myxococcaceae bacterium]|nr:RNA methyltransferase [Myxococcaceae bacterium]